MKLPIHSKIYVAGHQGLVGSAIMRKLKEKGYQQLIVRTHAELDLTIQSDVIDFFTSQRPEYVILAAAKVGGVYVNNTYPADFIYVNTMIVANVVHAAFHANVQRLLFLGSSCIYPRQAKQPIIEQALLTGALEPSNEPYAVAKIAGIKLCESYNRQHQTDYRCIMPTNLYGINDNFHPQNAHVIPALMRRFHEAKIKHQDQVVVWGSGHARREFLFADDMALASLFVLNLDKSVYQEYTKPMLSHINIGAGYDVTIRELVKIIKKVVGYKGQVIFDTSQLEGVASKQIDSSLLKRLGWHADVGLEEGLAKTYSWFSANQDHIRS